MTCCGDAASSACCCRAWSASGWARSWLMRSGTAPRDEACSVLEAGRRSASPAAYKPDLERLQSRHRTGPGSVTDYLLAIDQGTTSTRAILFDAALTPVASEQQEFKQIYPAR